MNRPEDTCLHTHTHTDFYLRLEKFLKLSNQKDKTSNINA